jgi:hypothetical protein
MVLNASNRVVRQSEPGKQQNLSTPSGPVKGGLYRGGRSGQFPISKSQFPNKFQISMSNAALAALWNLDIEICLELGNWILGFLTANP